MRSSNCRYQFFSNPYLVSQLATIIIYFRLNCFLETFILSIILCLSFKIQRHVWKSKREKNINEEIIEQRKVYICHLNEKLYRSESIFFCIFMLRIKLELVNIDGDKRFLSEWSFFLWSIFIRMREQRGRAFCTTLNTWITTKSFLKLWLHF